MKNVCESILKGCKNGSKLQTLNWDYDPAVSGTISKNFIESLGKLDKSNLKEV